MKHRITKMLCGLLALVLLAAPMEAYASDGSSYVYDGYTYDYFQNVKESPAMFTLERTITAENLNSIKVSSIEDVCTSEDGRIFFLDKLDSRMNVVDSDGNYVYSTKLIRNMDGTIALNDDGSQIMLSNPEGLYIHEKNQEIYICHTGNKRIIVLDLETYGLIRIINAPDDLAGVTDFVPSKIVVDLADRIYVVVQSSYEGIIELTSEGEFIGYYGVNTPTVNLISYFWKSLASDAQKEKMTKTYAPAFNNLALDGEGFVMAVTYDSSAADMVFRLNTSGENVLREEGNTLVIGDVLSMSSSDTGSQFVDLAVTDYGTYAVIDKNKGRIFLYNFDGELLNAFGTIGNLKGEFKEPTSIAWLGDKLVVSDTSLKCIYVLAPTAFGEAVLRGTEYYYNGDWDEALVYFEQSVALNANYEAAYTGIGKNYLMKQDYETAMYYFKLGNNRTFYSKAYEGYRAEIMEQNFYIIMILLVAVVVAVIVSEVRYNSESKRKQKEKMKEINAARFRKGAKEE
ncbi:MAG: hypothetical protein LUF30_10715 [Lachnospiraceae bacterium]|nr:hypothetical protein [Lachnospiraceae bacterium]